MSKSALSKSVSLPLDNDDSYESGQAVLGTPAWKQEVNERLAAHRTRRSGGPDAARGAAESPRAASGRAAEAAARVAARYAKAPSYSELLAGEARAVVRAAGAAAEAARNAQAAAQAVLEGLEFGPGNAEGFWDERPAAPVVSAHVVQSRWQDEAPVAAAPFEEAALTPYVASQESGWAGAQPRWEEALPVTAPAPAAGRDVWSEMRVHPVHENDHRERYSHESDGHGGLFPYDPVAHATVEPLQHLPANLIEFPRELVATRKARPRLAEGPLYDTAQDDPQLSIFEVDPSLLAPPLSMSDGHGSAVAPPEWASIELEHPQEPEYAGPAYQEQAYAAETQIPAIPFEELPVPDVESYVVRETVGQAAVGAAAKAAVASKAVRQAALEPAGELVVARMSDRLMAAVVDGALVTLAFLAAAVVVTASTEHPPAGKIALIASGFGLLLFGLLYQYLFLTYAEEGTPGMRYARIALCTFEDDNPTRQQMQMRIPALLISALPVGLGLIWASFDGDKLGWHDRMTRTYQRKY